MFKLFTRNTMITTLLAFCLFTLTACSKPQPPVSIAINPWPGYEFLYLAEHKGFFKQLGADIKLVQLSSLGDAQRAYINGRVDGLTSTIIEAVQAEPLGGKPLKVVLVPDYSNGGDVILAPKAYPDMNSLKGKTIGCEVSSLGIFILQRALTKAGMTLSDVNIVNVEQSSGQARLTEGKIDAFITYPPVSVNILEGGEHHQIFNSSQIPFEIIDTVSIASDVLAQRPELVSQLHQAWQMALDYTSKNPEEAYRIMSEREGISADDFKDVLTDLKILDSSQQAAIYQEPDKFEASARAVCETLVHTDSLSVNCQEQAPLLYRGKI